MASTPIDELRVLLIQIRESDEVARHEAVSLREITGLRAEQLDAANVAMGSGRVDRERFEAADAVIIGGAAIHSAVDDDGFTDPLLEDIRWLTETRRPLFGSCWGHQIIARALGGEVVHDRSRAEVGAHEVRATVAARADPIFSHCPDVYPVLMGHEDRVSVLPEGAIELAYSDVCRNQAFRMAGAPVWGTQFHTELSPHRLVERLSVYRKYAPDDGEFERVKAGLRPTPDAETIMRNFLESVASSRRRRGARRE